MSTVAKSQSADGRSAATRSGRAAGPQIEDVQGRADARRLAINKVGICDIRHPVSIAQRVGGHQSTVATFGMYVNLPHHFKGTHMSRFVQILNAHEHQITVDSFKCMLGEMTERLEADNGHIEMSFPYFIDKFAPVTGEKGVMDYEVTFLGDQRGDKIDLYVEVAVPVTTLCPCSKDISDYGAHNQRSLVTLRVRAEKFFWLEELIDIAESEASSELYGILKRVDEKAVTERAYENPKFVEDVVRDIATRLNADERFRHYRVASENFESIHNHSAYALIEHDKDAPAE
ncbi:GTP cyclohydrolase [Salinisphaera orenii MK-B5]|uniref:GTP cyclohydrolase FolE2 n=2 Tax=Salinisphaera orenii TaxID=856731 RepID=A0A423PVP7_9GAMM|nr:MULTISPECIES: GTP cyclohydrolase FolE2 [Salinisphaera]ROO25217.1 GTP cyclohydrolase [Salinisphaera halophila YIM 95161]ROO29677.1 GTP cyclohydrolase [Salinisphaera orenii MK-B5]